MDSQQLAEDLTEGIVILCLLSSVWASWVLIDMIVFGAPMPYDEDSAGRLLLLIGWFLDLLIVLVILGRLSQISKRSLSQWKGVMFDG